MIRFAEPRDTAMVRALWEVCFSDDSGFNDYFFQHQYQPQHTLLLTGDAELCAMLQMLPYRLSAAEGEGEITYIYGACTAPAHRRKGCMARLLEQSFVLDQAAGRAASALIPAEVRVLCAFWIPSLFSYRYPHHSPNARRYAAAAIDHGGYSGDGQALSDVYRGLPYRAEVCRLADAARVVRHTRQRGIRLV